MNRSPFAVCRVCSQSPSSALRWPAASVPGSRKPRRCLPTPPTSTPPSTSARSTFRLRRARRRRSASSAASRSSTASATSRRGSSSRRPQEIEPDFALAYWGETLTYNHPLLPERDLDSPRETLARLGETREERAAKAGDERELGFLNAVEELFGEGELAERRIGYMETMRGLHESYPDDDEVAAFYALSLLQAVGPLDDDTFRLSVLAGSIALGVFERNPNHPGAAHYIIHAFDDPVSRAAGPSGRAPLRRNRRRRLPCAAHAVPHLHSARHVGPGLQVERLGLRGGGGALGSGRTGGRHGPLARLGAVRRPPARRLREGAGVDRRTGRPGRTHRRRGPRQAHRAPGVGALHRRDGAVGSPRGSTTRR